jgi:hypothetical protein
MNAKQDYEDDGGNLVKDFACGRPNQHVLNLMIFHTFDGVSYKEDFID